MTGSSQQSFQFNCSSQRFLEFQALFAGHKDYTEQSYHQWALMLRKKCLDTLVHKSSLLRAIAGQNIQLLLSL